MTPAPTFYCHYCDANTDRVTCPTCGHRAWPLPPAYTAAIPEMAGVWRAEGVSLAGLQAAKERRDG